MKKAISILLIFITFYGYSQENLFKNEDKIINLGIGFGSLNYSGSYYSTQVPPISASFELGILDNILDKGSVGIGGYVGYASYKWEYSWYGSTWGYKYTNFIVGPRASFHYPLLDKLDSYSGLMVGFEFVSGKEFGNAISGTTNDISSGLIYQWYAGARYYVTDNFAGMFELGYGISYFNIGIAYKL
jgi:hypothetical protein